MGYPSKNTASKSLSYSRKETDYAWDRFLSSNGSIDDLPVRNLIADSWGRCLTQGVNPEQTSAPILAQENDLHSLHLKNPDLMVSARPVLTYAQTFLKDLDTVLFITDNKGINLEIVGDPKCLDEANKIGLVPGCGWDETISGSNAVGTAIATHRSAQVHGEEHYCQGFKPWTCTAAIIRDPYDNQIIGVVDISGLSNIFDKFHIPLVEAWARQIQSDLAIKTLNSWNLIHQQCERNLSHFHDSEFLLLDKQGRLVSYSENINTTLKSLDIDYKPESKCRLSLEGFGGDEIIYPHDDGRWVSGDWLEPVQLKNEVIGFQIHLPSKKNKSRQQTIHSHITHARKEQNDPFSKIHGESLSIRAITDKAHKAAVSPLPVLILGETGVGKELFAQAIHDAGNHSDGPFIDLNCGGLTKDILNAELFGHVEGAFTGSKRGGMKGKIEAANGGTLFLDEIGEMPLETQPIFLRVLQERKIYRVGGIKPIDVDFKLIAATHCNLKEKVAEGLFRQDLYYRLSTVTLGLPSLSTRKEDIEGMIHLTMERCRSEHTIIPKYISPSLLNALKNREWPGNVRELVNVVECMCFLAQKETLTIEDLPEGYGINDSTNDQLPHPNRLLSDDTGSLDHANKQTVEAAILQAGGNITQAAKNLGIAKGTLYRKMKKYNLENHR